MNHNVFKILFFGLCILQRGGLSQLADSPWPMYQHDSRHTGKSQYSGVRNPSLAWSYKLCDDAWPWVVGDIAVGMDQTIYVPVSNGTGMGAQEGFLYAINPDGTFKWKYQFEGICVPAITVPAIASDGTIYIHVNGNANIAAQERIYALNPNGTKKWEYLEEVAAFVTEDLSSPVVATDGSITYTSTNTASTRISSDGVWLADLLDNYYNSIHSSPSLISGDTIYVSEDGAIKAYRSIGGLIWANELPGDGSSGFQGSPSIDTKGTIYYANRNNMYALSLDGTTKWIYPLNTSTPDYGTYYAVPAISSFGPIVSTGFGLLAINNDGSLRWKITKENFSGWSLSPTIDVDDIIYWQCLDTLFIIDEGAIIGKVGLPYTDFASLAPRQSAAIMPDSTIVCINSTYLIAIKNIRLEPDIEISPDTLFFGTSGSGYASLQPSTLVEPLVVEPKNENADKKVLDILPIEQTEQIASLTAPLSNVIGDLVTLVYDDGFPSSYYVWGNGKRMAVRMSPAESCKITAIQIYCPSGTQSYKVGAYSWTGTAPGTKLLETSIVTSSQQGWATTDVSSYNINVTGDFVASFNMIDNNAGLGFDPSDNGRAWDFDGTSWSSWNETYFIRAVVEYGSGTLDTIATMSVTNTGNQQLEITDITADQPWIRQITPTTFSVGSSQSKTVTVKVSPNGLSPGTYYGSLHIGCNDPDESSCAIPVKFLVTQATGIVDRSPVISGEYFLWQNYPNPFNPITNIKYQIPTTTHVSLKVFDILGREVATLVDGIEEPGYKSVEFDGSGLTSGMYLYQLQADSYISVKKMLLLR